MRIIGLTGGIGSGKTTVAKEFRKLGVPIYIADERSKELLSNDVKVINEVQKLLGPASYRQVNRKLVANRTFIASKVFNDKELLNSLNKIMHPAVRKDFENYVGSITDAKAIIYEAAILLETNGHLNCDDVILVTAPLEDRIQRVISRDKVDRKDVFARLKNQWDDKRKLEFATIVLVNENINELPVLVRNIHYFMLNNK